MYTFGHEYNIQQLFFVREMCILDFILNSYICIAATIFCAPAQSNSRSQQNGFQICNDFTTCILEFLLLALIPILRVVHNATSTSTVQFSSVQLISVHFSSVPHKESKDVRSQDGFQDLNDSLSEHWLYLLDLTPVVAKHSQRCFPHAPM
jgi:hypothetical protein